MNNREKKYTCIVKGRIVDLTQEQLDQEIEKSLTLEERVKRIELYLGIKNLQDFVKRNRVEL